MDTAFFLTCDEIETLTGFKAPARQTEWLHKRGWRFEVNGNRKPVVARKYAERMLGCGPTEDAAYRPNYAALARA